MNKFLVRFVNLGWCADERFASVTDALLFAKDAGFDAAVERVEGGVICGWSIIGGDSLVRGSRGWPVIAVAGAGRVRLTAAEFSAVVAELATVIEQTEGNPGPYHAQHHAAKRALRKMRLMAAGFGMQTGGSGR